MLCAHGQKVGKTNNMKDLGASKPKIANMIFFLEWMVYLNIIKFAYTCTFAASVDTYFDDSSIYFYLIQLFDFKAILTYYEIRSVLTNDWIIVNFWCIIFY